METIEFDHPNANPRLKSTVSDSMANRWHHPTVRPCLYPLPFMWCCAVKSSSLRRRLAFMTVSREKCPARLLSDTGTLERCGTPPVSNRSEGPQVATFHCSEDIVGHLK